MILTRQYPARSAIELEMFYRGAAAHEAGHLVMFSRFGVSAEAHLQMNVGGEIAGGIVVPEAGRLTALQSGAVGWAGIVGEYLLDHVVKPRPEIPALTARSLAQWHGAIWESFRHSLLSYEDRSMIFPDVNNFQAAALAFRVLSSPAGSGRLYVTFRRLTESFRREHQLAAVQSGSALPTEVSRFAQSLFEAGRVTCT